jgi:hypothetical protein
MRRIVHLPNPNELYLRLVEEMYEPEAVESRLAYSRDDEREFPELDFDADEPGLLPARRRLDEPAPPAPAVVQREIIYQIGALSNQLATLSAAIQRLSPAPDESIEYESTDHIAADSPDDVDPGPHRRVVPRPLPRRRPTNFSAPVPEATD